MTGRFITFEGIDGTGKSTQVKLLCERLQAEGYDPVRTREPGGTEGAEDIRQLLVTGEPGRWDPMTETLLFYAARRDHVKRLIIPSEVAGKIVVCDRFADSSRAYQGQHGEAERAFVDQLHTLSIGLEPDLTIVLDMDPEVALARTGRRVTETKPTMVEDRYERMGLEHMRGLREQYRSLAAEFPKRIKLVSAEGTLEEVADRVYALVEPLLPEKS